MTIYNPYEFVQIDWANPGDRRPAPAHDRFSGISGRLAGTITPLTPLFIPDKRTLNPQRFIQAVVGRDHMPIIPGASLKGLFRNLVETVSGGAFWFCSEEGGLPLKFRKPGDSTQLDAAGRMFGFLERANVHAGNVTFTDAYCQKPVEHPAIYTCVLSGPKTRHRVWYFDREGNVAGRKFYFHSDALRTERGMIGKNQNAYIKPVGVGSGFTFAANFTNVAPDDFALLLYALVLEPTMRHKLGYAKPAGLGSIHVQLTAIETIDYPARYRTGGGSTHYAGATLAPFVDAQLASFVTNQTSPTLRDLRRIWQWPALYTLRYPTQQWFEEHPTAPISATEG